MLNGAQGFEIQGEKENYPPTGRGNFDQSLSVSEIEFANANILQKRVKDTVQSILSSLKDFTDWEQAHILECVAEELYEAKLSPSL